MVGGYSTRSQSQKGKMTEGTLKPKINTGRPLSNQSTPQNIKSEVNITTKNTIFPPSVKKQMTTTGCQTDPMSEVLQAELEAANKTIDQLIKQRDALIEHDQLSLFENERINEKYLSEISQLKTHITQIQNELVVALKRLEEANSKKSELEVILESFKIKATCSSTPKKLIFSKQDNIGKIGGPLQRKIGGFSKESNIFVMGDSHGRNLGELINNTATISNVLVTIKPGAHTAQVLNGIRETLRGMRDDDHLFCLTGSNDAYSIECLEEAKAIMRELIDSGMEGKRVTFCSVPINYSVHPHSIVNSRITQLNNALKTWVNKKQNIDLLDISYFPRKWFTRHGLHLTMKGKKNLCNLIVELAEGNKINKLHTRNRIPLELSLLSDDEEVICRSKEGGTSHAITPSTRRTENYGTEGLAARTAESRLKGQLTGTEEVARVGVVRTVGTPVGTVLADKELSVVSPSDQGSLFENSDCENSVRTFLRVTADVHV